MSGTEQGEQRRGEGRKGEEEGTGRRGKEEGKDKLRLGRDENSLRRWRRGREGRLMGRGSLPFSPFHSGWLPARVSGCVVTFDPGAGGLQWQRQL